MNEQVENDADRHRLSFTYVPFVQTDVISDIGWTFYLYMSVSLFSPLCIDIDHRLDEHIIGLHLPYIAPNHPIADE